MITTGDPPLDIYQKQAHIIINSSMYMIEGTLEENYKLISHLFSNFDKYPDIYSIFNLSDDSSNVYIELQSSVPKSLEGYNLKPAKISKILPMLSKTTRFVPQHFYKHKFGRISSGLYNNDVCEILGLNENKDRAIVRVIPRVGSEDPSLIEISEKENYKIQNITIDGIEYPCYAYKDMMIYQGFNILVVPFNSLKTWSANITFDELVTFIGINDIENIPDYIGEYLDYATPKKEAIVVSSIPTSRLEETKLLSLKRSQTYSHMADIGEVILCCLDMIDGYSEREKIKIVKRIEKKSSKLRKLSKNYHRVSFSIDKAIKKYLTIRERIDKTTMDELFQIVLNTLDKLSMMKSFNRKSMEKFLRIEESGAVGLVARDVNILAQDVPAELVGKYRNICGSYQQNVNQLRSSFKIVADLDMQKANEEFLLKFDIIPNRIFIKRYRSKEEEEDIEDIDKESDSEVENVNENITEKESDKEKNEEEQTRMHQLHINDLVAQEGRNEYGIFLRKANKERCEVFIDNSELNEMRTIKCNPDSLVCVEDDPVKDIYGREIKPGMTVSFTDSVKALFLHSKDRAVYCIDKTGYYYKGDLNKVKILDEAEENEPIIKTFMGRTYGAIIGERENHWRVVVTDNENQFWAKNLTRSCKLLDELKVSEDYTIRKWENIKIKISGKKIHGCVAGIIPKFTLLSCNNNELLWISNDKFKGKKLNKTNEGTQEVKEAKKKRVYSKPIEADHENGETKETKCKGSRKMTERKHSKTNISKLCVSSDDSDVVEINVSPKIAKKKSIKKSHKESDTDDFNGQEEENRRKPMYEVRTKEIEEESRGKEAEEDLFIEERLRRREEEISQKENEIRRGNSFKEEEHKGREEEEFRNREEKLRQREEEISQKEYAIKKEQEIRRKEEEVELRQRDLFNQREKQLRQREAEIRRREKEIHQIEYRRQREEKLHRKKEKIRRKEEELRKKEIVTTNKSEEEDDEVQTQKEQQCMEITPKFFQLPHWLRRGALIVANDMQCVVDIFDNWAVVVRPVVDGIIQHERIEIEIDKAKPMPIVVGCRVVVCAGTISCHGLVKEIHKDTCKVEIDSISPTKPVVIAKTQLIRVFDPMQI